MPRALPCLFALLLTALAGNPRAHAQSYDGAAYFSPVVDMASPVIYGNVFSPSYLAKRGQREAASKPRVTGASTLPRVTFDPAISASVKADYIAQVARQTNASAADGLRRYYDANDVRSLFDTATRPYGLRNDDLADIGTAFLTVMWMTANDTTPPGKPEVLGLREQVRQQVATGNGGGAQRQRIGEALMYATVTLIRVREAAQQSRQDDYLAALSASAQASMAAQAIDLRALAMTPQGLVPR